MHQASLGINSQPNPVFDTEPRPMSETKDGALAKTMNPNPWPTICQHLPPGQPVSLHTCPQKSSR